MGESKRLSLESLCARNSNFKNNNSVDTLFHIGVVMDDTIPSQFGDVRVVCMGGSPSRMQHFAEYLSQELACDVTEPLTNHSTTDRYVVYKVCSVLCVSHGIGIPSLFIILNEIIKLLHYAGCRDDVIFLRMGTCGGLGLEPGTLVVSERVVDGLLRDHFEQPVLGKLKVYSAEVDKGLVDDMVRLHGDMGLSAPLVVGTTMCAGDFYEGQGRLDGAICDYTAPEKMEYLQRLHADGVRNIEMESLGVVALCRASGFRAVVIATVLVNRLQGDLVQLKPSEFKDIELPVYKLVKEFVIQQQFNPTVNNCSQ